MIIKGDELPIGSYSYKEFKDMATMFHNYPAPGLMLGGYMVEAAKAQMPDDTPYEALVETTCCLPDAAQMLTPCTIGNGCLKVENIGKYAVTLYDKFSGEGVRVSVCPEKIEKYREIKRWFLALGHETEQNTTSLQRQIALAGASICDVKNVNVSDGRAKKQSTDSVVGKEHYSIGDMSKICNISTKALRYYDKINLIPSQRNNHNNYRYYTRKSLLTVPVVKYYKQMGFTLDEMREFIEGSAKHIFKSIQHSFRAKIRELEDEQEKIRRKHVSVKGWYGLIREAEMALDNNINEVSVKYIDYNAMLFQNQFFKNDMQWSIINPEFTQHVEAVNNEIEGVLVINFSSRKDRIEGIDQHIKIMQKTVIPCSPEDTYEFGGDLMLSCYHLGAHEDIHKTYLKMERWAAENDYQLEEESFERYITDYWTTNNSDKFVTEVLIKCSQHCDQET